MKIDVLLPSASTPADYQQKLEELHISFMACITSDINSTAANEVLIKINTHSVYHQFSLFTTKVGRDSIYMTRDEIHSELSELPHLDETIKHLLKKGLLREGQIEPE